jgi:hypothetical protein
VDNEDLPLIPHPPPPLVISSSGIAVIASVTITAK